MILFQHLQIVQHLFHVVIHKCFAFSSVFFSYEIDNVTFLVPKSLNQALYHTHPLTITAVNMDNGILKWS